VSNVGGVNGTAVALYREGARERGREREKEREGEFVRVGVCGAWN